MALQEVIYECSKKPDATLGSLAVLSGSTSSPTATPTLAPNVDLPTYTRVMLSIKAGSASAQSPTDKAKVIASRAAALGIPVRVLSIGLTVEVDLGGKPSDQDIGLLSADSVHKAQDTDLQTDSVESATEVKAFDYASPVPASGVLIVVPCTSSGVPEALRSLTGPQWRASLVGPSLTAYHAGAIQGADSVMATLAKSCNAPTTEASIMLYRQVG